MLFDLQTIKIFRQGAPFQPPALKSTELPVESKPYRQLPSWFERWQY